MPRLPDFSSFGAPAVPQLPRSIAGIDTRRADEIMAPGRAEIGAGGVFEEAANQLENINTLKAEDAFNKLREKQLDLTTGPQNGFVNVRGGDAIDPKFIPGARAKFTDAQKEVASTLTNDRQQFLFQQRAKVAELQYNEHLLAHVHQEDQTFQSQTNQAVINTEVQHIAASYNDPRAIALSHLRISEAIAREATRLGWSKEERNVAAQKAQDAAGTARFSAQMVADPVGALKAFNEPGAKEQLSPALREHMYLQLRHAAYPVEAKNSAMEIIAGKGMQALQERLGTGGQAAVDEAITEGVRIAPYGSVNPPGPGAPGLPRTKSKADIKAGFGGWVQEAEAIAEREHPGDPIYRDLLVANVKGHMNTLITAQDGISRAAFAGLMSAATPDPKSGQAPPLTYDQLVTTPELKRAWDTLDPQGVRGILGILEHNNRQANGLPIRTNTVVFESIWRRINLPYDDPRRIRQVGQLAPYLAHGINVANYDWFKARIDEAQTPDGQRLSEVRKMFFDEAKAQFDSSTMLFHDSKGKSDNFNFWQYATNKEREFRAAGKDPYLLYNPDPKNPDFLGNKIPAFKRSLEQRINDMAEDLQAQTPQAAQGAVPGAPAAPAQPQPGAQPVYPEGTTMKHPKTGERIILRNGKWEPIK